MSQDKTLIVGLGNPGAEYAGTRHNVGFRLIDELTERWDLSLAHRQDALIGWIGRSDVTVGLAKPLRYVNRSGSVVKQLVSEHDIQPEGVLVLVDDLHLDAGVLRLRPGGSDAGHNGMADIIRKLGTESFPRLRIGIGNDYQHGDQADYVLSPFTRDQAEEIEFAMQRAVQAIELYLEEGADAAMNRYNG